MYRDLFIDYLEAVLPHRGRKTANPKTISDYLDGLSGRIGRYAKKYYPPFVDVFQLGFEDAKKILTLLINDEEFLEHCKGSKNVQITSLNHYSRFIDYVKANKSNRVVSVKGKEKSFASEGAPHDCHSVDPRTCRCIRIADLTDAPSSNVRQT